MRIAAAIEALSGSPRPPGAKKLHAGKALFRIRSGAFRVIYQVRDEVLLILVLRLADRKDAYRDLESLLKG